jgi:hypothetical protein
MSVSTQVVELCHTCQEPLTISCVRCQTSLCKQHNNTCRVCDSTFCCWCDDSHQQEHDADRDRDEENKKKDKVQLVLVTKRKMLDEIPALCVWKETTTMEELNTKFEAIRKIISRVLSNGELRVK